ncbi:MAG TPA: GlsB/YeaQ/YmgE family stress response membrane protein [Vicinamibacterales bacterium]|nr:GlsB/YeaQ/YmgE family stress response membrane protein [Vicinamibacterales bacterium]
MGWIITIIIGGIIGWIASIVMKTNAQMGILANILVGVVGSLIGSWLAGVLGVPPSSALVGYLFSIVGAVILIAILKALGFFKR